MVLLFHCKIYISGPRPPSDAHGRFTDLSHPLPSRSGINVYPVSYFFKPLLFKQQGIKTLNNNGSEFFLLCLEMFAPRTSSPCTQNGSVSTCILWFFFMRQSCIYIWSSHWTSICRGFFNVFSLHFSGCVCQIKKTSSVDTKAESSMQAATDTSEAVSTVFGWWDMKWWKDEQIYVLF